MATATATTERVSIAILLAETPEDIGRCHEVMRQLRPHLEVLEFARRVQEQWSEGYHLARLEADGEGQAVAGYRFLRNLAWGHILYVDDLVTHERARSKGYGQALMKWLIEQARMA